jgi:hypothetical protein
MLSLGWRIQAQMVPVTTNERHRQEEDASSIASLDVRSMMMASEPCHHGTDDEGEGRRRC